VTGAAGFVGQWLCRDLVRGGWSVVGTSPEGGPGCDILSEDERSSVTWLRQDLRDPSELTSALDASEPDVIFHLAGVSFLPDAGDDPTTAFEVNAGICVRLLRIVSARRAAGTLDPVVLVIGSGEQYGRHDAVEMPLPEAAECRPCSFYAATKLAQEVLALEAFRGEGTQVICTRSFNHSGLGQAPRFLVPGLVARALRARAEGAATLDIGNTGSVRDFLHVEDTVRAYVLLAERGAVGEVYNVSSGLGVTVADVAAAVQRAVGLAAQLSPHETLVRRTDVAVLVGRNDKLCTATGWAPRRALEDIINDLIHAASD
jgi:GDP-4-dehydro-6-deoxy-D-mannose reductase